MTDAPVVIPLAQLHPHPDNPRLVIRQDVVDAIAASVAVDGFASRYALTVRPHGDGYQILAGHHRKLAAEKAGLEAVPCWVVDFDDERADEELVSSNQHGELHPLEEGQYVVRTGKPYRAYAERFGKSPNAVQRRWQAARFAAACTDISAKDKMAAWSQCAEGFVAAEWLWQALGLRLFAERWNVDTARGHAGRLKDVPEPPAWADRKAVATKLVAGDLKPADLHRMASIERDLLAEIDKEGLEVDRLKAALAEALQQARPSSASAAMQAARPVRDELARLKREKAEADRAAMQEDEQARERAKALKKAVTVEQWHKLDEPTRQELLACEVGRRSFVKQKNADIEWAMWSHNPVTGCRHECPYCYARAIAENRMRFDAPAIYPDGFTPTFHPDAVQLPRQLRPPAKAETDHRYKNVFLCSMADLYGRWVPREWIEAVLHECELAPWWNFLCLTKFPKRMAEFDIPSNVWMGTTVDLQARVAAAEAGFARVRSKVRWLSIEPLLEPLRFKRMDLFDWVVIGGASAVAASPGYAASPEWRPPFEWIADIVRQAREVKAKVYFKTNFLGEGANRILELPFDAPIKADPVEAPAVFHYLKARGETKS
jgi:ParB/RepB/Spo0J family partition protein